jgi:hypothetical protein
MMFILHKKVCHYIRKHWVSPWIGSSDCYSIWNAGQGERDTPNTAPDILQFSAEQFAGSCEEAE